jgi:hypothetical protein
MLNIVDLAVAAFVLIYLLKNAGGILKTIRNLIVVLVVIIIFGVGSRLLLNSSIISGEARKTLDSAYFVKMATTMISWAYPSIEQGAPKVDSFIKDNIIEKDKEKFLITPEANQLAHPESFIPGYQPAAKTKPKK